MQQNYIIKFYFFIFISFLLYYGCIEKNINPKNIYRAAFESDIPSLDPIQIGDTQSHDVGYNIYNGLVTYRPQITGKNQKLTDLIPDLAESWVISNNNKTYTFKIRKGVKFHNGRELIASDFKYSIERLANPKNASKGLWTLKALPIEGLKEYQKKCEENKKSEITGIKILDRYTLQINLTRITPFALHILAMSYYYVVPKEEVLRWKKDFTFHPVGTGPFIFKEWKRGQRIVLIKNPNYFEKNLPYLDELHYYIVPSEDNRFMRFECGELEHTDTIPSARFYTILDNPKWNKLGSIIIQKLERINDPNQSLIIKEPLLETQYLGIDNQQEPFKDKKVRQALNYAVDKEKIIDKVLNGRGLIVRGVLPFGFPGFNPNRQIPYPYNPQKAKELLKEAGWKDNNKDGILDKNGKNFDLTLWHNQSEIHSQVAQCVQADLKDIGINIEIRSLQWAPYIEKIRRNEAKLFRMGWQADYPDPDNFIWTLLATENIGQDNHSRYSNKQVDDLLKKARNTNNWGKRKILYQQAESIIVDDAPWIFLYNRIGYKIVQPYVVNQQLHPLIQNVMKIVKLKK